MLKNMQYIYIKYHGKFTRHLYDLQQPLVFPKELLYGKELLSACKANLSNVNSQQLKKKYQEKIQTRNSRRGKIIRNWKQKTRGAQSLFNHPNLHVYLRRCLQQKLEGRNTQPFREFKPRSCSNLEIFYTGRSGYY